MYVTVCLFLEDVFSEYMTILDEFINVFMNSFPKEVCPCRLWELTKMVRAKHFGSSRTSKDLSASCIILNSALLLW